MEVPWEGRLVSRSPLAARPGPGFISGAARASPPPAPRAAWEPRRESPAGLLPVRLLQGSLLRAQPLARL